MPDPAPVPRGSVLVADDEPQLLRLLRRVLEGDGYQVVVARSSGEAMRACADRRAPVQVAVLDAGITPDGSGAVLESLAGQGDPPRIVLTSGDDALAPPLREMLERRAGIFLRKPFSPSALLRSVEELVARGDG